MQNDPQLGVRLPADLKERLRRSASDNRRSMNGEIIVLLERSLPAGASPATPADSEIPEENSSLLESRSAKPKAAEPVLAGSAE